jgi:hypothetical protein
MKPIRWRNGRATVEGVRLYWYSMRYGIVVSAFTDEKDVRLNIPSRSNKQQRDAAAYALADLVATLKGME